MEIVSSLLSLIVVSTLLIGGTLIATIVVLSDFVFLVFYFIGIAKNGM